MEKIIAFIISLLSATVGFVGCQSTSNNPNQWEGTESEYSTVSYQSKEESENELFQSETESVDYEEESKNSYSSEESQTESDSVGGGIVLPDIEW